MLCWTSGAPTAGISELAEMIGQVVGARKQTCVGRAPAFCAPPPDAGRSSGLGECVGADISLVDSLEALGGLLDARVRAHPALLLERDRIAVEVGVDDGTRDLFGVGHAADS